MTDQELAQAVKDRARELAAAMNCAAEAGLHINLEMRPHERQDFADGNYRLGRYMPILSINRTVVV